MSVLLGIVTRNRRSLLTKAINSAYAQLNIDLSVEVIDDGSTDDTISLKTVFPQVKWTFLNQTHGYLAGRNRLMQQASQEYYCSLDDDSWFMQPDSLRQAVEVMDKDPRVGCVAFDILSPDCSMPTQSSSPVQAANFIGCGHLLRLSAVREVGFYSPNPLKYGGEEKDMCLGLLDLGYTILFLPGIHVWHEKTTIGRDLFKQHEESMCNDLVITFRRAPWLLLFPLLFYKILRHGIFAFCYENGKYLKAYGFGLWQFIVACITFRLDRKPVKMATYMQFVRLVKKKVSV